MRLRIAARSSELARLQAHAVGDAIKKFHPDVEINYQFRESLGDKNLVDPLWKMPEKGVFTEDFYKDLTEDQTDLVVHSWKDLPVEEKPLTEIAASLPRADQRDLLLFKKKFLQEKELKIFTSSPRRAYNLSPFLKSALPAQPSTIEFTSVRGNVPTRIRKLLEDPTVHGLVLAKAALDRFLESTWAELAPTQAWLREALSEFDWMVLPLSQNPNAAAQGALAIEVLRTRDDIKSILQKINDSSASRTAQAERQILSSYGGGCHQKIGVAILPRAYGDIQFLRGLTDRGEVLDVQKIVQIKPSRDFETLKKWSSSEMKNGFTRETLPYGIPSEIDALFVSRISAWQDFTGYVWVAGLETWKKLARLGVWVHGSSEGLGEQELPRIDALAGRKLKWGKLTHDAAMERDLSKMECIPTYHLKWIKGFEETFSEQLLAAEICFWTSPTHFALMHKLFPQIITKKHASGPGLTAHYLRDQMNLDSQIFLHESHFLCR